MFLIASFSSISILFFLSYPSAFLFNSFLCPLVLPSPDVVVRLGRQDELAYVQYLGVVMPWGRACMDSHSRSYFTNNIEFSAVIIS